eukprot:3246530-Karenia_brevis.AAC.1
MAISKVMYSLRKALVYSGLVSSICIDNVDVPLHEVGYVDDSAIPCFGNPAELVNKTAAMVECSNRIFNLYAMQLNFSAGKSEALAVWRGPGSAAAKRALLFEKQSVVACESCGHKFFLRFVESYKHLGTQTDMCADVKSEVSVR